MIPTMRVMIIDDEQPARLALRDILQKVPGIQILAEAANAQEAMEKIGAIRPDLLFLDIEMPEMSGIEMLSHMDPGPLVIFVTAFSEHAVKAFELNALDYVLKPIRPERVREAVERARLRFATASSPSYSAITARAHPVGRIPIWNGNKVYFVRRSAVLYAKVEDEQVILHTSDGKCHPFHKALGKLEELVEGGGFFRVSRATLVNLEAVQESYPGVAAGAWCVRLIDESEHEVSRERSRDLRERLGLTI